MHSTYIMLKLKIGQNGRNLHPYSIMMDFTYKVCMQPPPLGPYTCACSHQSFGHTHVHAAARLVDVIMCMQLPVLWAHTIQMCMQPQVLLTHTNVHAASSLVAIYMCMQPPPLWPYTCACSHQSYAYMNAFCIYRPIMSSLCMHG